MTDFIINGNMAAIGEMSVQQELVDSTIIVTGTIQINRYIEEIITIECRKFYVEGVSVIKESLGTNDDTIIYTFIAEKLSISAKSFNDRKE